MPSFQVLFGSSNIKKIQFVFEKTVQAIQKKNLLEQVNKHISFKVPLFSWSAKKRINEQMYNWSCVI